MWAALNHCIFIQLRQKKKRKKPNHLTAHNFHNRKKTGRMSLLCIYKLLPSSVTACQDCYHCQNEPGRHKDRKILRLIWFELWVEWILEEERNSAGLRNKHPPCLWVKSVDREQNKHTPASGLFWFYSVKMDEAFTFRPEEEVKITDIKTLLW